MFCLMRISALVSLWTMLGCAQNQFGGFSGSSLGIKQAGRESSVNPSVAEAGRTNSANPRNLDDFLQNQIDALSSIDDATWQAMMSVNLGVYFEDLLFNSTNEPIEVYGYTFEGLHDYLLSREQDLFRIADQFPTVGDYLDTHGIHSPTDITDESMSRGIATTWERIFGDGAKTPTQTNGFQLRDCDQEVEKADNDAHIACGATMAGIGSIVSGAPAVPFNPGSPGGALCSVTAPLDHDINVGLCAQQEIYDNMTPEEQDLAGMGFSN